MIGAEAIQGKRGERAHEKNVCLDFITDDNLFKRRRIHREEDGEDWGGALKVIFCFEMSSYSEGLYVSDDIGIVLSHLGPRGSVYSLWRPDSRSWNENGKPWSNHMSSAGNAFLGICGLSIWAAGDGVVLNQGRGKGPGGNPRPWAQQEL